MSMEPHGQARDTTDDLASNVRLVRRHPAKRQDVFSSRQDWGGMRSGIKITSRKGVIAPQGFKTAAIAAGVRKSKKKDMMLLVTESPATASGIFTINQFAAAPVMLAKAALKKNNQYIGILINSGSANACTGRQGYQDALVLSKAAAKILNCHSSQILTASTGVIGERLPISKMINTLPTLASNLQNKEGLSAAEAIMTTDTVPKMAETKVLINDAQVTIGGIAKGSGMIQPNMATMLAVITTDIVMPKTELSQYLKQAAVGTFNAISVDGENSTNDTVFIMANGAAGPESYPGTKTGRRMFIDGLTAVLDKLAEKIVLDGEGAGKFIEIIVKHAHSENDAMVAARAIGDSQLVKTAVYGEDANWGRILQSLGATTVKLSPLKVDVSINSVVLVKNGIDAGTSIAKGNKALKKKIIKIVVDLKTGQASFRYRTCDLTKDYIDINAGYRS